MRAFFIQFSGLIGIVTFLNNLWSNASLERTVFVSLAVGFSTYLVLMIGDNVVQQILKKTVPEDAKVKNETVAPKSKGASAAETAQT